VVIEIVVLACLITLGIRLWSLQEVQGPALAAQAADNSVRDEVLPAPRGAILDDAGRALVEDSPALVTTVDPQILATQRDHGKAVLAKLAAILHENPTTLNLSLRSCSVKVKEPCWPGSPYQPIPVSQDSNIAITVDEHIDDLPGVAVTQTATRRYTGVDGANAAHMLGYVGAPAPGAKNAQGHLYAPTDIVGRAGLEIQYNNELSGSDGMERLQINHLGHVTAQLSSVPSKPGDNLVTSLDAGAQAVLEKALTNAIANAHSQDKPSNTAAGVVLDARTGRIVAMASLPTYDPRLFVGGISAANYASLTNPAANDPLLDRAFQGEYAPGSTFKLTTSLALLTDGDANQTSTYGCPPSVQVGTQTFHNFESESFPPITLHQAIVVSCDTFFYGFAANDWAHDQQLIAQHQQPLETMQHVAMDFGLGKPSGVDLPGEATGLIEDRTVRKAQWNQLKADWCAGAKRRPKGSYLQQIDAEDCTDGWRWRQGDQLNFAVGQGTVLVSPLQLATAYAALVNGGKVFSPRVGEAVVDQNGHLVKTIQVPVRGHLPFPTQDIAYVQQAMYDVPLAGTASGAFAGFPFNQVQVGGKTGTAQVQGQGDTSWFASFAGPAGQPAQFVTVIMVPQAGQGAHVAAPAVRQVWEGLYGLNGQPAALPGGKLPALPIVASTHASAIGPAGPRPAVPAAFTVLVVVPVAVRPGAASRGARRGRRAGTPASGPAEPVRARRRRSRGRTPRGGPDR
jgi:penicillin-binding protein 2